MLYLFVHISRMWTRGLKHSSSAFIQENWYKYLCAHHIPIQWIYNDSPVRFIRFLCVRLCLHTYSMMREYICVRASPALRCQHWGIFIYLWNAFCDSISAALHSSLISLTFFAFFYHCISKSLLITYPAFSLRQFCARKVKNVIHTWIILLFIYFTINYCTIIVINFYLWLKKKLHF